MAPDQGLKMDRKTKTWRVRPRFLLVVVATLVALATAYRLLSPYLVFRAPGWKIVLKKEVASPDGAYVASLVDELGPAYVANHAFVSLRPSTEVFDPSKVRAVFLLEDTHNIELNWKDDRSLLVTFSCPAKDILGKDGLWRDVEIKYQNLDLSEDQREGGSR